MLKAVDSCYNDTEMQTIICETSSLLVAADHHKFLPKPCFS